MITAVLIGAGQRGAHVYAQYALDYPQEFKFVAVAEPNEKSRDMFVKAHGIADDMCFINDAELFEKGKIADCALVCTQDNYHTNPVKKALSLGYHVLCEKPMSPSAKECIEMSEYAEKYGKTLTICHVLRYSPFFSKVKEIIDTKKIGDIVAIQHTECVSYWHQAHSFVRGNWRNTKESNPMILAKSCHDMDILYYLLGKECKKVSSFGSLKHFKEDQAPVGSGTRCLVDCKIEDACPYSAKKIYLGDKEWYSDTIRTVVAPENTNEAVAEALKSGPYGRCVYKCDNDVVDHQVVNLEFEDGITVSFTMCAFTYDGGRIINVMGTKGQILGNMEKNEIEVFDFLTGTKTVYDIKTPLSGHSGSDEKFMKGFLKTVETNGEYSLSSAKESLNSHLIAFAAEESRLKSTTINMQDFYKKFV